ncbi:hypothetical protein [Mycolicibacterium agri]|uniref:hypothetical protein n=1 Tax=Mycolicibacterium agri TaxID=36811 RepID=UPI001055871F|nr:hypothetical protein [Mycolicibacterium agri]
MATQDERNAAMDRLPLPYSIALRLRTAGIPDNVIAECLGVAPEAVGTLLQLAEAKLAAQVHRDDGR